MAGYLLGDELGLLERLDRRTSLVALVVVVVAVVIMSRDGAARTGVMITLASGLSYVDLNFLGVPRVIATAVMHGPGGVALIDPGPSSTLPALRARARARRHRRCAT